ncbi:FAD-binding oxidoreductase [Pendulispora brunnea]|uniref:FAD-binding oxidoreductase n=1 Tax=Pendulispora brunnea TaxID=2905690 RepID=A0ABZ2KAZ8_9BACT
MTKITAHSIAGFDMAVSLSRPGEVGYATATDIWARPSGAPPLAVAHCRTAVHVQLCVRAAREHGLPLSVRGGGHGWTGNALCPGGLVIDLTGMRNMSLEAYGNVLCMGGGTLARDVFRVADRIGRAAVTGSSGAVGMAGLTLGGGYGALIGRHGLALDNLLSAQVVLADGSLVMADDVSNPELFWALRGGGGNFGVVTQMRHRLHALDTVYAGPILYSMAESRQVLRACAEFLDSAPDDLTVQIGLLAGPDGQPVLMIAPTWIGHPADAERQVAPFTLLGKPLAVMLAHRPPGAANSLFDEHTVNGNDVIMGSRLLPRLEAGSIDAFLAAMQARPSPGCAIVTHEFRGAATRVPTHVTAFGLRREHVLVEIVATWERGSDPDSAAALHRAWVSDLSEALAPFALPGGYANVLAESDDPEYIRASYGPNANRLAHAKRTFDPDNVFARAIPLPTVRSGSV